MRLPCRHHMRFCAICFHDGTNVGNAVVAMQDYAGV
jgi:hypothetical protein